MNCNSILRPILVPKHPQTENIYKQYYYFSVIIIKKNPSKTNELIKLILMKIQFYVQFSTHFFD